MAAPLGNQNHKGKLLTDALRKLIVQNPDDAVAIAKKWIEAAKDGDHQARKDLFDRLDGKPVQTIAGDEEAPLAFSLIERVIIDKASASPKD